MTQCRSEHVRESVDMFRRRARTRIRCLDCCLQLVSPIDWPERRELVVREREFAERDEVEDLKWEGREAVV